MNVEYMRTKVMSAYPGGKWAYKVQHMPESQVLAVFLNLKERGAFEPKRTCKDGKQISMYEAFGIKI